MSWGFKPSFTTMNRLAASVLTLLQSDRVRRFGRWAQQPPFQVAIIGLVTSLAFLQLLMFLVLNWYSLPDADISRTGFEVMLGIGNGDFADTAFGFGRSIDLLLVLTPLTSIALLILAIMVFAKRLPYPHAIASAMSIALIAFLVPWLWQDMSSNAMRSDFDGELLNELLAGHHTTLPLIMGLLMVLVSVFGWGIYQANQLGWFSRSDAPENPASIPQNEA